MLCEIKEHCLERIELLTALKEGVVAQRVKQKFLGNAEDRKEKTLETKSGGPNELGDNYLTRLAQATKGSVGCY